MIAVGVLLDDKDHEKGDNKTDDDVDSYKPTNSVVSIASDCRLLGPNKESYLPDRSIYHHQPVEHQNSLLSPLPRYQPPQQQLPLRQSPPPAFLAGDGRGSSAAASTVSPSQSPLPRYRQHQTAFHKTQQTASKLPPLPRYQPPQKSLSPASKKQQQQPRTQMKTHVEPLDLGSTTSSAVDDHNATSPSSSSSSHGTVATVGGNGAAAAATAIKKAQRDSVSSASSYSSETRRSLALSGGDDGAKERRSNEKENLSLQKRSDNELLLDFRRIVDIKDNRYRMRRYKDTFVGCEAVDALIQSKIASTREDAVEIGRMLAKKYNLFKHVCDDHIFKDNHLFYRYTN